MKHSHTLGNHRVAHPALDILQLREVELHHRDAPLMERAGAAAAEWACLLLAQSPGPTLVLAGPGNNGGDGFVVARLLAEQGLPVCVVFPGDPARLPADAREAWTRFQEQGGQTLTDLPETDAQGEWALVVDALFGIGLDRPLESPYRELIDAVDRQVDVLGCPVLALDLPSGLNGETGALTGPALAATHTITFIGLKPGLLTGDGPDYAGEIRVAPLGLTAGLPQQRSTTQKSTTPCLQQLGLEDFSPALRPRPLNSHKGTNGSVGIIGGADSMVGAICLASRAALCLGAGRVFVAALAPGGKAPGFDPLQPEIMFRDLDLLLAAPLTVLAAGPGLGQSAVSRAALSRVPGFAGPLVLDADALNLLAGDNLLQAQIVAREYPTLLTPHPAEAARLLGQSTQAVQRNRIAAARDLAHHYRAWVALKGYGTVIAAPEGDIWINPTGNPGMGTAGMGDVLTGILAALLAQGWSPRHAMLGAVFLHGAAADLAVSGEGSLLPRGPIGLTASETIPLARQLLNQWVAERRGRIRP